ncbi:MAG: hypothetical protein AB1730_04870 [Myxococcota bacterium]
MRRKPRSGSRSDVQQAVESLVIDKLGRRWKTSLSAQRLELAPGIAVALDGYCRKGRRVTAVEVTAQLGHPKPAQQRKVLADALKLALVRSSLRAKRLDVRAVIAFIDKAALGWLQGQCWAALACRTFGVELEFVDVGAGARARVRAARRRQDLTAKDRASVARGRRQRLRVGA